MKFLLLVVVIVAVAWWLGRSHRRVPPPDAPKAEPKADPTGRGGAAEMVACAHCGLHVPRQEALPGPGGAVFCTDAHRQASARDGGAAR